MLTRNQPNYERNQVHIEDHERTKCNLCPDRAIYHSGEGEGLCHHCASQLAGIAGIDMTRLADGTTS